MHASVHRRRWGYVLVTTAIAAATITATTSATGAPSGTTGASSTYLVVTSSGASTSKAVSAVTAAGGTVVADYSQIGVVVARASSANFASTVKSKSGADAVSTAGLGVHNGFDNTASDAPTPQPPMPAPGSDSLSGLQWDMDQINAPAARAITGGSPNVIVGDIDTGLDYTHPDLAANVDFAKSASCIGGVADTSPAAWMDDNGHGTHTAGTIAAAKNGIGIVGVAPKVKIAGIKAGNADGFFFPEAVICSFMWAGTHDIAVTNNSYFADPWLFNCKNDPEQRAIWTAERRAIAFAQQQGTLVVAAAGNQADDLKHPTQDATSPDDTTPVLRDITNACAVVPVEVPGVVSVTATGDLRAKSFYSSYGVVDVAAPGGDSVLQLTAGGTERTRPLDVASVAAHGHLPAGAAPRRRLGRDLLLPAGHLDGQPARRRRGGADRQRQGQARLIPGRRLEAGDQPDRLPGRRVAVRLLPGARQRRTRRRAQAASATTPGTARARSTP